MDATETAIPQTTRAAISSGRSCLMLYSLDLQMKACLSATEIAVLQHTTCGDLAGPMAMAKTSASWL